MRTSLATLAAASLIAVLPTLGATPATAAAPCSKPAEIVSTTISPRTVVIGVSQPKGIEVTTKIRGNGCRISGVELGLYGPNFVESYDLHKAGTSNGVTTYETGLRITPGSMGNSEAGRWQSWVTVHGQSTPEAAGPTFRLLRAARLSTNAAPEPVRKGRTVTVTGTLSRADWDSLRYRGYGSRPVSLQFRTTAGSYRTVKTVSTAKDGGVRATITASKDGCFRFVFPGSATTAAVTSPGDCVDVR